MDINEEDDYPELSKLIDHCLWYHEEADKFEEIIKYCLEEKYDIFNSDLIHKSFYLDDEKIQVLKNIIY